MEKNKVKILAIDDNKENLITLKALIKDAFPEYVTLTANNGDAGIALATSDSPDVILLDILMPVMDGFEVCQNLKSNPLTLDIPVVFLTALKDDKKNRTRALEVGADSFLAKPVDKTELIAQIRVMLKIKMASDQKRNEQERLAQLVVEQTRELKQSQIVASNLMESLRTENEARKINEAALSESEQQLKEAQRIAGFGTYVLDIPSGKWKNSDVLDELFGIDESYQRTVEGWTELLHPDDRVMMTNYLTNEVIGKGRPFAKEYRIVRHDDRAIRWVYGLGKLEFNKQGQPIKMLGLIQDITERKQADDTLRESEERYRTMIDWSPEPIRVHRDEKVVYVNPAAVKMFGAASAQDLIGESIFERLHPDSYQIVQARLKNFNQGAEVLPRVELQYLKLDGTIVNAESQGIAIIFDGARSVLSFAHDVTERKQTEEALRASAKLLSEAQRVGRVGHWEWKSPNAYITCSDEFFRIYGLPQTAASISQQTIISMTYPDDREWVGNLHQEAFTRHTDLDYEFRVILPDGRLRWLHQQVTVSYIEGNNRPMRMLGIIQDVTERKQAEDEIKHHLSELEVLYESGLSLSRLLNPKEIGERLIEIMGEKLDWNHAAIRLYHPETEHVELLAMSHAGMDEDEIKQHISHVNQLIVTVDQGLSGWVTKYGEVVRSNNLQADPRYVETSMGMRSGLYVPIKLGDEVIGSIAIETKRENAFNQQDERLLLTLASQAAIAIKNAQLFTTVQKARAELEQRIIERTADLSRANAELDATNAELKHANRLKDEFLSSMSHELRTPLTGILGLSEALQMKTYGELSDKQLRALHNIELSGRHLLELINDILDLSKIEAGKFDMRLAPCALSDICQSSLQLTKGMVHQRRQQVDFSMKPATITVRADTRRLKQMLVNLLSNAIKFTAEEGLLGLEVEGDEKSRQVKLTVWDKGIGIKPEDIQKLFKPFVQLDSSLARQYSGTGLGLSLVKRMAELHGGRVEVESTFGEGSRFAIILPWIESDDDAIVTAPDINAVHQSLPFTPAVILIADDNEVVLEILSDFLLSQQYQVATTNNGQDLLTRAAELKPNLLLVDIQMPGMDGLETIRRLRAHADPSVAATPVIAVTALAMTGDREICLAAGANDYLSKPVSLPQLLETIKNILHEKQKA